MMLIVDRVNAFFQVILYPFEMLPPLPGLVAVSLLISLFSLGVFRVLSRQDDIKSVRSRIGAHILELRLFGDHPRVMFSAPGNILRLHVRYARLILVPLGVLLIPMILLIVQLHARYGVRPLHTGEDAVASLVFQKGAWPEGIDVSLEASPGIAIETPPLRISNTREIDWRIRAVENGVHELIVSIAGQTYTKNVHVTDRMTALSPTRVAERFPAVFLNPGEPPLPRNAGVSSVSIGYGREEIPIFGRNIHWLIILFCSTLMFSFVLKRFLNVEL